MNYSCDVRLKAPFTLLLSGPTGSGKSCVAFKIIRYRSEIIKGRISRVVYCLPPSQTIDTPEFIKRDKFVEFFEGIPDFESLLEGSLLILDDLMSDLSSDTMALFTRNSHHRKISVMLLTQNIFYGVSKFFRTISLNTHILIIMKNPRDRMQISTLASQIFPENPSFLKKSYAEATRQPYSYILLDLTQRCPDSLRFRTNIFPCDTPQNVFFLPAVDDDDNDDEDDDDENKGTSRVQSVKKL